MASINFTGTDYLGISQDVKFREFLNEGFEIYGNNFGGSRLSGTYSELFFEAESRLAQISGAESAVTFSSGTLAGLSLKKVLDSKATFIYAPDTHPALSPENLDNIDFKQWQHKLVKNFSKKGNSLIILSNSLNALKSLKYDFSWTETIAEKRKVILVVDDSHGFGVLGENGKGVFCELPSHPNIEKIVISSLNKAWGVPGGAILASEKIIETLKQTDLFGGASPIIPAYLYAFLNFEKKYYQNRRKLRNNLNFFIDKLTQKQHFTFFENFPVFSTQYHNLPDIMKKHNVQISAFNYPTPKDERYTRIVITEKHTEKELLLCINAVNSFFGG